MDKPPFLHKTFTPSFLMIFPKSQPTPTHPPQKKNYRVLDHKSQKNFLRVKITQNLNEKGKKLLIETFLQCLILVTKTQKNC